MTNFSTLKQLRIIAFLEGLSYILLLGIAMPLKYIYSMPLAVRIFGMAHGVLFIFLVIILYNAHLKYKWGPKFSITVFISSLIPLGAFWMDRVLQKKQVQEA
jgi:integral membrane protein